MRPSLGKVRSASWLPIAAAICVIVFSPSPASAQQDATNIRAAYLFNILKYVNWPAGQKQIKVAVLGNGRVASAFFQAINGQSIAGREICIFQRASDAELDSSDVLYFPQQSPVDTRTILNRISHPGSHPVLTIGETEQFLRGGGMISLSRSLDHIQLEIFASIIKVHQLEINADSIGENRVKLSSGLLNIAILKHFQESSK